MSGVILTSSLSLKTPRTINTISKEIAWTITGDAFLSETTQFRTSPCGRWYVIVEITRCLGDSQQWFSIHEEKTLKQLVKLYEFPFSGIYFSPDYDYLFLEKDDSHHDIIEIKTGKSLAWSNGAWHAHGSVDDTKNSMTWPRNNAGLVPLHVFLEGVPENSYTFGKKKRPVKKIA